MHCARSWQLSARGKKLNKKRARKFVIQFFKKSAKNLLENVRKGMKKCLKISLYRIEPADRRVNVEANDCRWPRGI